MNITFCCRKQEKKRDGWNPQDVLSIDKEVNHLLSWEANKYSWCNIYTGGIWGTQYSWGFNSPPISGAHSSPKKYKQTIAAHKTNWPSIAIGQAYFPPYLLGLICFCSHEFCPLVLLFSVLYPVPRWPHLPHAGGYPGVHHNHPCLSHRYPSTLWRYLDALKFQISKTFCLPQTACPSVFQSTWQQYLSNHSTKTLDSAWPPSFFLNTKSYTFYFLKVSYSFPLPTISEDVPN